MRVAELAQRLRSLSGRADPYVTRGARPEYRKGMRLFWWYGALISASSAFVDSYVTLYALSLGATGLQIGTLSSVSSLFSTLGPIPGAQWAARWGRKKPVVVVAYSVRELVLLAALLVPLILFGQTLIAAVIALMALRSGLTSLATPAWTSFAADLVPTDRRGRYFSSRKTVMGFSSLLFVPLAGLVIEWVGWLTGYQAVIAISIVIGAAAVLMYAFIPEPASQGAVRTRERSTAVFVRSITGNRAFLVFTLIALVFAFSQQLGGPYFSVYEVQVLGATPRLIGILSTLSAIARMVGQQFWGRLVDRRGARWVLAMCHLLIPVLPFIWFPLTEAWQLVFVTVPSGFLWAGHEIANFNMLLELPKESEQTQAVASYHTLIGGANILGPLVGGLVVERLGYLWNFGLSGVGRFIAALLLLWLLKPFRKPQVT